MNQLSRIDTVIHSCARSNTPIRTTSTHPRTDLKSQHRCASNRFLSEYTTKLMLATSHKCRSRGQNRVIDATTIAVKMPFQTKLRFTCSSSFCRILCSSKASVSINSFLSSTRPTSSAPYPCCRTSRLLMSRTRSCVTWSNVSVFVVKLTGSPTKSDHSQA